MKDPHDENTMEMNFDEHKTNTDINVQDFENLCAEVFALKQKHEAVEQELSKISEEMDAKKQKIMSIFDSMGKEKHFVGGLGTLYIQNRFAVSMPPDPGKKREFFDYLRKKGIFEDLVTVNYQTLNAYYKKELDAAAEEGNESFVIPGIGEPKLTKILAVRKA